jgi:hypothetical protein
VNVSSVIARIGGFVEVETGRTSELMGDNAETGGFETPEIFLAVTWMSVETFFLALEVTSGVL